MPAGLRDHLFERLRERRISADDLYQLKLWRESEPDAPEGPWYKDFGSFKICGQGKYPAASTFAARHIVLALSERKFDDARGASVQKTKTQPGTAMSSPKTPNLDR
ncbi:MAG: hypothetical protein WBD73_16150 [Candidatus Acidiferrales bacterium]